MTAPGNSGFSLIEVLIALVVLAIGVLAAAGAMAHMTGALAVGSVLTRASMVGTNGIERLHAGGCRDSANDEWVDGIAVRTSSTAEVGVTRYRVVLRYPLDHGWRTDTLALTRACPDAS